MLQSQTKRKPNSTIRLSFGAAACLLLLTIFFIGQKSITEAQTVAEKRYKPELVIQTGHNDLITSVAFSPDGKILASGSFDGTIKLWSVETGQFIKSLEGHTSWIYSIAFSPNGKTLASGSLEHTVRIWNIETGQQIKLLKGHSGKVSSVVFSPDGKILASASGSFFSDINTIKLWNSETGEQIKSIEWKVRKDQIRNPGIITDPELSIVFSPDGKNIASASWEKVIRLWDVETGNQLITLQGHSNWVLSVTFSHDGKLIASASDDKTVKLWDAETGNQIRSFVGHTSSVFSVSFSPNGKILASGSYDNTVKLWNVETGEQIKSLTGHSQSVNSVAFSPDGETLASGSTDKTVKLWDTKVGKQIKSLDGHTLENYSVAFSPDGKILASGNNEVIKLWDIETGRLINSLQGNGYRISFSPDGKILASGGYTIKLWDTETGQLIRSIKSQTASSITFSDDGKTLASGGESAIELWDVGTGQLIKSLVVKGDLVKSVAFSPDGKILASGNVEDIVQLWSVETGQLIKSLEGHQGEVRSVTFSRNGRTLVSGSADHTIKLWDVETFRLIKSFNGHTSLVNSVTFSSNEKIIISGCFDSTIKLWDVESGQEIRSLEGHTNSTESVALSRGGKILASGSQDGTIKLWNIESGENLMTLISLDKDDWVVTSLDGSFDASEGALKLMHFVVFVPNYGYEVIMLDQLKSKSLAPGLLRDIYAGKWSSSSSEFSITLYPALTIEQSAERASLLNLKLRNRGGGIGRVEVQLNGSEIISDARVGKNVNAKAASVNLLLELPKEKLRGGENKVEVIVWNLEGDVRSRSHESFINLDAQGLISKGTGVYRLDEQKTPSEINFYAIIAGVSDYAGDQLDLRYAAKDAEDIANAVSRAARRYFCSDEMNRQKPCERVHLRLLSTEKDQKSQFAGLADVPDFKRFAPVKQNFKEVFAEIAAKAKPEDVVFVYLSGHGTAITSDEAVRESAFPDMYLYPTMDATTLERNALTNQTEREAKTVNSLELAKWVFDIKAAKKVMIFDTCAAGAAQKDLIAMVKGTDEDRLQIRSLDRLRERTGFYVLMGSASDKVSYEANEYRQGLLTYSLIEAMTVDTVLDDGRFLDIEKWFNYAENKVEDLAKGIGGVQKPSFFKGESKTFAVGRIETDERNNIKPARKVPLILQPALRVKNQETDDEDLTEKLEARLMELSIVSARGETSALNYIKATKAANGLSPRGFYTVNPNGTITAEVSLIQDKKVFGKVKVTEKKEEIIEVLITEIIKTAQGGNQ